MLFAGFRPGHAFGITGADIVVRDMCRYLRLHDGTAELYGAGELLGTWALGKHRLRARLHAAGYRTTAFARDRVTYSRRGGAAGTLFATSQALLDALDDGLRAGRWATVVASSFGAEDIARRCRKHGVRTVLYVMDWTLPATKRAAAFYARHGLGIAAVSRFMCRGILEATGARATLVPPPIDFSRRVARSRRPRYVTLMHASEFKGVRTFLALAERMPDVPFLLVDGWGSWWQADDDVIRAARALRNVRILPSQDDTRRVYAMTRLLLVPSIADEGFGLVAPEAHSNGIPVIASRVGGIPEAVGRGGILIRDPRDVDAWLRAVRRVLSDGALRARLVAAGRAHAAAYSVERDSDRLVRMVFGGRRAARSSYAADSSLR